MEQLPFYDIDAAQAFIAGRTGEPFEIVGKYIDVRNRFQEMIGVASPRDSAAALEEEKQAHADLLTSCTHDGQPCEDVDSLIAYVRRVTGLGFSSVINMFAAEVAYEESVGIVEKGFYDETRAWANEVLADKESVPEAQAIQ